MSDGAPAGHEGLLRDLTPRVVGAVTRRFGDFAAAEDAVQEALLAAHVAWGQEGLPANPGGWLFRVACRRQLDRVAAEEARRRREEHAAGERAARGDEAEAAMERDDTLELLFLCCHPALTPPSAVALTLRAVGGLSTAEIARAFLVPEATMAQRISRAKQTLAGLEAPFAELAAAERPRRLAAVLHVLYLVFNEGYLSSSGTDLVRVDLCSEALRLARTLHRLQPAEAEVEGLLALLLLTDARRAARAGPAGELIPLHEQDRRLWDGARIAEGLALVDSAFARGGVGSYALQAAIAALHDVAASVEATDWREVLTLYDELLARQEHPLVALNRLVAVAMVRGAPEALVELDRLSLDPRLAGSHRVPAVRAHLLELADRPRDAIAPYRDAAARATSLAERHYLIARAGRLAQQLEG